MDESGFELRERKNSGYAPCGKRLMGEISGKRGMRVSIIAGMLRGKPVQPVYFQWHSNSKLVREYLKNHLLPSLPKGSIIAMDNASFHKTKTIKRLIWRRGFRLLYLSPYSPDFNPIEHLWPVYKGKLRKLKCTPENYQKHFDAVLTEPILFST
jgi:transposase